jgi:hypothetical protein
MPGMSSPYGMPGMMPGMAPYGMQGMMPGMGTPYGMQGYGGIGTIPPPAAAGVPNLAANPALNPEISRLEADKSRLQARINELKAGKSRITGYSFSAMRARREQNSLISRYEKELKDVDHRLREIREGRSIFSFSKLGRDLRAGLRSFGGKIGVTDADAQDVRFRNDKLYSGVGQDPYGMAPMGPGGAGSYGYPTY